MKGVKNPVAAALNTLNRPKKVKMKTHYDRRKKEWRKVEKNSYA